MRKMAIRFLLRIYKDSGIGKTAASYYKTYTYDLAGNRTGFTLEKGGETVHNINYSYDNLNRLSTVFENGARDILSHSGYVIRTISIY